MKNSNSQQGAAPAATEAGGATHPHLLCVGHHTSCCSTQRPASMRTDTLRWRKTCANSPVNGRRRRRRNWLADLSTLLLVSWALAGLAHQMTTPLPTHEQRSH